MDAATQPPKPRFSKRQRECLQGVADHLDSQQIAQRLGISPHTVDGHIAAALKTIGARSRRDGVRLAGLTTAAGQSLTGNFPPVDFTSATESNLVLPNAVREASTTFEAQPRWQEVSRRDQTTHRYLIILSILGGALAIAILLIALAPLVRGAEELANAIQPFHR